MLFLFQRGIKKRKEMKPMKKIVSLFCIISLLLSVSACSNAESEESTLEQSSHEHVFSPATCMQASSCIYCGVTSGEKIGHDVIDGKCSMCNMDYYDELAALILKHGELSQVPAFDRYEYVVKMDYGECTIGYIPAWKEMTFRYVNSRSGNSFYLYVDKTAIKNQEYDWCYT